MTQEFQKFWLKIAAIIVGSFGPIFFLGTMEFSSEPARMTLDLISWPYDGGTTFDHPDTRLLSALAGGFLFGWGITIWLLAVHVHDIAPEPVRKSVVWGFIAWFVLDSSGSVFSGNPFNVVFNSAILLAAVGPLWRPAEIVTETKVS